MMTLSSEVIARLSGKTLVTAESCTGGGIGTALTGVAGSSGVYKGGIICYTNWVKTRFLDVPETLLSSSGPVSAAVAQAMARGARSRMEADIAVSVTGLAGPGGDEFGNPVGTVFIGYCDSNVTCVEEHCFPGDREAVRNQAIKAALRLILMHN